MYCAVAVKKQISGEEKIVGHVPRKISAICSLFIRRGGVIRCIISGRRRYSSDLPQGGLEIPCILVFTTIKPDEGRKAKNLIQCTGKLSVKVSEVPISVNSPVIVNTAAEITSTGNENVHLLVKQDETSRSPLISLADQDEEELEVRSPQKKRAKCVDVERIIMGEELCDIEINFAQQLLKAQFTKLNGFVSTLYQEKKYS